MMSSRKATKLHETAIKLSEKRQSRFNINLVEKRNATITTSVEKIGEINLAVNYSSDQLLQNIINLLKKFDKKKFHKLPKIWQQKFRELSLDDNNFIYVEEKLVIPEELRVPIFRKLHWGHPGRDVMIQAVADIWWPQIHRDVVILAKSCTQCQNAGKNIKTIQKQAEYGTIPAAENHNDEIAINFAGPFKVAPVNKKYMLVSIDQKTNCPDARFMRRPTTQPIK